MNTNTCLLYNDVNEVYEKLLSFCYAKGFKIKENTEKFYFIKARKGSFFFWKTLRMELYVETVEKKKVEIKTILYKNGKRQPELEKEYTIAIENFI